MDPEGFVLGPRAQRALSLIAAALAIIVIAGLLYLHQARPSPLSYNGPSTLAQLDGRLWPAFDFVTPSLGWAAIVDSGLRQVSVYRTDDGAGHWSRVFVTAQPLLENPSLHFFDAAHGFLNAGRLYSTSDGGGHWTTISVPDGTGSFTFSTPTRGWALDGTLLYATQDGGLTWRTAGRAPPDFYGAGYRNLAFRANGEGWGGGEGPTPVVYATFDGGGTWRSITLPGSVSMPSPEPAGKAFVAGYYTQVLLVPGGGVVTAKTLTGGPVDLYLTLDRGATWRPIKYPPMPTSANDIAFVDSKHWWASQLGLIYKTSDAGQSWRGIHTTFPDGLDDWRLNAAHVIDGQHAWLVITSTKNRRSALTMSSDGGAHWSLVNLPELF